MIVFVVDHEVAVIVHDAVSTRPCRLPGNVGSRLPNGIVVDVFHLLGVQQDRRDILWNPHIVNDIQDQVSITLQNQPETPEWRMQTVAGVQSPPGPEVHGKFRRSSTQSVYRRARL